MEVAQGLTLNTWLYLPPDREIKDVLLVTDGEVHAEEVPLLNLYQPHDSAIVYFSPEEASLRGDFLGNIELVASSLKNHVLPWAKTLAEQKGKVWPVDASDYIIAGGSLGGYAAAGIVLIHPEIALNAIVQSAALWWPDRQYWLLESWQEHIDAPAGIKRAIFHEYGRYDIRLSQENVELANVLSQADNVTSTSREYNGGHNYLSWRQGLIEGHNKGLVEGQAAGEQKKQQEIIKNALENNFDVETIAKLTKVSTDEVLKIKENLENNNS